MTIPQAQRVCCSAIHYTSPDAARQRPDAWLRPQNRVRLHSLSDIGTAKAYFRTPVMVLVSPDKRIPYNIQCLDFRKNQCLRYTV